ncbi:hypothetical protein RQP46_007909 [Phenoliferia psychrophenolica]
MPSFKSLTVTAYACMLAASASTLPEDPSRMARQQKRQGLNGITGTGGILGPDGLLAPLSLGKHTDPLSALAETLPEILDGLVGHYEKDNHFLAPLAPLASLLPGGGGGIKSILGAPGAKRQLSTVLWPLAPGYPHDGIDPIAQVTGVNGVVGDVLNLAGLGGDNALGGLPEGLDGFTGNGGIAGPGFDIAKTIAQTLGSQGTPGVLNLIGAGSAGGGAGLGTLLGGGVKGGIIGPTGLLGGIAPGIIDLPQTTPTVDTTGNGTDGPDAVAPMPDAAAPMKDGAVEPSS